MDASADAMAGANNIISAKDGFISLTYVITMEDWVALEDSGACMAQTGKGSCL